MFTIQALGPEEGRQRLISDSVLTPADFFEVARQLEVEPFRARKVGLVAARQAERVRYVETHWEGIESTNTANRGDWIATNLSPEGQVLRDGDGHENTYVIKADVFSTLYDKAEGSNEFGTFYRPKGVVDAIFLSGGFDIVAPWGERQKSDAGHLLRNDMDVYGNNAETFEATYKRQV